MKDISFPATSGQRYLEFWYTQMVAAWETYCKCLTDWQSLQETACLADDCWWNCKKWAGRLMAYEEWADTNIQPEWNDTIELTVSEAEDDRDTMEFIMMTISKYPSVGSYVTHLWTGLQPITQEEVE